MIRIDVDPRAPPRPSPAPVRGRPPRLPPARRAPAQRRRGRRAAEGSRGAAALRDDRAGRRRARPDPRDDPLALPARPVPAALGARRARLARRARARARRGRRRRRSRGSPAGRLDRARRLIDPEVRERRAAIIAAARGPYLDPAFEPADASRALLDAVALRGTTAKDSEEEVVDGLDLTPREAEQRIKRVQRGAEREEMLAQLEELAAWYRDLVVVASGAESADDPRRPPRRPPRRRRARPRPRARAGGGARAPGVALGGGVQRQRRPLARRALRAAPARVRLTRAVPGIHA